MAKKTVDELYRTGKLYEIRRVRRSDRKAPGFYRIKCRGVAEFAGRKYILFTPTKGY